MNASLLPSSPAPLTRHRLRRIVTAMLLVGVGAAAGTWLWGVRERRRLQEFERQLVLAQNNDDAGAVGELARRITRLDGSPARLLTLCDGLLRVRLFADLEDTLNAVERVAPERGHEVVRLRAREAEAKREWRRSISLWADYLESPAVAAPDRVTGLDALVSLLVRQARWEEARARIDCRLALADGMAARLVRAHVEIRQRQWAAAGEDFRHLAISAPENFEVKETMPAWERIQRSLGELTAADSAMNTRSAGLRERLVRAQLCARLGLWQNAADDLQQAAFAFPSARMPGLLGAALGLHPSFTTPAAVVLEGDCARALPWLASSATLARYWARAEGQWALWQQLAVLDEQLACRVKEPGLSALERARVGAERARVIFELGLWEPALNEALEVLRGSSDFMPAQKVVIRALLAEGNTVQAAGAVERALAAHAAASGAPDLELSGLAGLVWQAQGRHAQAVEALTSGLAGGPRADLLRARARSLRVLQRFAEAAQDGTAADELDAAAGKGGAQ